MGLLPEIMDTFPQDVTLRTWPTRTYNLRFDGQPSFGKLNGLEAMKQAIFLILSIPRFRHEIFSWNYGSELEPLFGQVNSVLLQVRVQEAIRDALMQDDRITDVTGFSFARRGTEMAVSFVAETTEGNVESVVLFAPGTDTECEVIFTDEQILRNPDV